MPPGPSPGDFKGRRQRDGLMGSDTSDAAAVCGRSVWPERQRRQNWTEAERIWGFVTQGEATLLTMTKAKAVPYKAGAKHGGGFLWTGLNGTSAQFSKRHGGYRRRVYFTMGILEVE